MDAIQNLQKLDQDFLNIKKQFGLVKQQIEVNYHIALWIGSAVVIIIIITVACIWKARKKAKRVKFLQEKFDGQNLYAADILVITDALESKVRFSSDSSDEDRSHPNSTTGT